MKFKKEDLIDLMEGGFDDFEVVHDQMIDKSRWSIIHELVFKYHGKFYATTYRYGATESQDERPFEYDPDEIECKEVFPVLKTITVYE